jgi:hypothetical protein
MEPIEPPAPPIASTWIDSTPTGTTNVCSPAVLYVRVTVAAHAVAEATVNASTAKSVIRPDAALARARGRSGARRVPARVKMANTDPPSLGRHAPEKVPSWPLGRTVLQPL